MSLPVGFVAVGITAMVGVALGLIAGYYGRAIDSIIMRWVDLMLAFPGILLAMAIVAILGTSLFNLMLAVGIAAIPEYTRVVRGTVLSVRETEALARRAVEGPKPVKARSASSSSNGEGAADVVALQQDLADALGLKVQLSDKGGKGDLTIRYGSLEQLDDLCRRLMRG
jgi:hypothetical protein